MEAFIENKWKPKETVQLGVGASYTISTKGSQWWGCEKTKWGLDSSGGTWWEGKYMGKLMGAKAYSVRIHLCRCVLAPSPSPVIRTVLPFLVWEQDTCRRGNLFPAFRQGKGRELFLCLLFLNCLQHKIIFMPNDTFGMAYSDALQLCIIYGNWNFNSAFY